MHDSETLRARSSLDMVSTGEVARAILASLLGAGAIALAAQLRVPVPGSNVPMTLQLLSVLLVGLWLPGRLAVGALLVYLACGAAGVPVFFPGSKGLVGPTGGYLVGFVAAVWLMAAVRDRVGGSIVGFFIAGLCGACTILGIGVLWLLVYVGGDVRLALSAGLLPFWWKALLEVGVAVSAVACVRDRRQLNRHCGLAA